MQLIFVYNVESKLFNRAFDFAHKVISPSTYACSLCSLTYGNTRPNKLWVEFIDKLDIPVQFLYKNQFESKNTEKFQYPAIFMEEENRMNLLLSADYISSCSNLAELMSAIETNLKEKCT